MTEESDVIARLYPYHDRIGHGMRTIKSSTRYMPPVAKMQEASSGSTPRSRSGIGAGTGTGAGAGAAATGTGSGRPPASSVASEDQLPYIEVRFSDIPRTRWGVIFGTDPDSCDVILPDVRGIDTRHFALTYKNEFADGCHRLVVRDLGTSYGTIVTCDDREPEPHRNYSWVIHGDSIPDNSERIIIQVHEDLMFQIRVMRHDLSDPDYISNVERFIRGAPDLDTPEPDESAEYTFAFVSPNA